jgi:hypothetical protein
MSRLAHGDKIRDRVWLLIKALVTYANSDLDPEDTLRLRQSKKLRWRDNNPETQEIVANDVTKHDLAALTKMVTERQGLSDRQVLESLAELRDFLAPTNIFTDNRAATRGGKGNWHFTVSLWFSEITAERRDEFDAKWAECHPQGGNPSNKAGDEADPESHSGEATPKPSGSEISDVNQSGHHISQTVHKNNGGNVIAVVEGNLTINS